MAYFFHPTLTFQWPVCSLLAEEYWPTALPETSGLSSTDKPWGQGSKTHYPSDSIASINNGTGAKKHFSSLNCKRINRNNILQVSASKNGIVHPDSIHCYQNPVGRKALIIGLPPPPWLF
ncbi:MAG: hypothetical protein R2764_19560 [Bacteroidales bacterium]